MQLCCLADAYSRLSITNTTDIAYLDNWIVDRTTALEKSSKKLEFLHQRRISLEELTRPIESTNCPPSEVERINRIAASQLSQLVLPSVLSRGCSQPFSQVLDPSNPPLLSITSNQESTLSLLQREYDQQTLQLKHLIEREREAKKVSLSLN